MNTVTDYDVIPKTADELANSPHMALIADLAWKYAKSFAKVGLTVEDMEQEGFIQLSRKLEKYDAERGAKFNTWAYHVVSNFFRNKIKTEHSYIPNSLDKWMEEQDSKSERGAGHRTLGIPDEKTVDPSEEAASAMDWLKVKGLVSGFAERDQEVLKLRFHDGLTLAEIGEKFGITRERVRQIEADCISKLRAALHVEVENAEVEE